MKNKFLGVYDYTVVLTYIGMLASVLGILFLFESAPNYNAVIICLMVSGVCDMFDGLIASTKKNRTADGKRFGIQIDSMCDLISFGVLPAFFVYRYVADSPVLSGVITGLFILAALIRLSYFNVLEENRQNETDECRKNYLGVPVTSVALLLPAFYLILCCKWVPSSCDRILLAFLTVLGFCFLAPIKIKKPRNVGKIILLLLGIAEFICLLIIK